MALTLNTDPSNYQISKNVVIAELETDAYVLSPGGLAILDLAVSGTNTVGAVFNFIWEEGDKNVAMEIVSGSIDGSGLQVREKGAFTDAQYAVMVAEDLNKNYTLSDLWTIEASGDDVVMTAKLPGVKYDLTVYSTFTNTGYIPNFPTLPFDVSYAENYKMKADLYMESEFGADDFTKVSSQELDPIDSVCIFDFQEEINANLEYDLPSYGQVIKSDCLNVIKQFYLKYTERYGSPAAYQQVAQTNSGYCLKAGVPTAGYNGGAIIDNYYTNKFLTKQPRTKKIRANQPEFLYFLAEGFVTTNYLVRIDFVMKDKSSVPAAFKYSISSASVFGVYILPCGYDQMNTGSYPAFEDLEYYTVSLVDADVGTTAVVSEVFTFYADSDTYVDESYVLFTNSRGGVDTFRFKGVKETGFSVSKAVAQNITLYNTAVEKGEFSEVNHLLQDAYKLNTGFITKAEADWLKDFFIAEKKLLITDTQFVPFTIENTSASQYNSRSMTQSYEFDIKIAYQDKGIKEYA